MSTSTSMREHAHVPDRGIDLAAEKRPGVPRERPPRPLEGAHWSTPEQQTATVPVFVHANAPGLTPVFGTASPPHGWSGELRRVAYEIPDHRASHWVLLLVADRVDAIESDLGGFVRRSWPMLLLATAVGVGLGAARRPRRFRWF